MKTAEAAFHALVAETAPDLLLVLDGEGVIVHAAATARRVVGWAPNQLEGRLQSSFVHLDDRTQFALDFDAAHELQPTTSTYRFRLPEGTYRWVEAKYGATTNAAGQIVVLLRDIAERAVAETAMRQQLSIDALTGVGNRGLFADRLQHALSRLARQPGRLAVLMLDIDRFKVINDALGHSAGDEVLMALASRLTGQLRPGDTLARLGGDEFAILAEDLDSPEEALLLAERITTAARSPISVGTEELVCSMSIGVAVTEHSRHAPDDLMQRADLALYRAKGRGRDRAEMFDEELRTRAVSRLATERMLRRAVHEGRILVEYQPIVQLQDERVVGAEALVRISDPPRTELLFPSEFLAVAEETGILREIDEWVMQAAIKAAAGWSIDSDRTLGWVSVNVTARALAGGRLVEQVMAAVEGGHARMTCVRLEFTEPVLMAASKSSIAGLATLRDAGIQIGLDDFGTGHSSLAGLRRLPLDFIKIDKSFIDHIVTNSMERAVATGMVELCQAMGLTVIAEGVEDAAQANILASAGCDLAQGFVFGASAPVEAF